MSQILYKAGADARSYDKGVEYEKRTDNDAGHEPCPQRQFHLPPLEISLFLETIDLIKEKYELIADDHFLP